MKMKLFNRTIICLTAVSFLFLSGCEDRNDLTAPSNPSTGSVDFTTFVTLGNSITAGYQSGSLYESAQKYSYGKQIANLVGTTYVQQLFSDPGTAGRIELSAFTTSGVSLTYNTSSGLPQNTSYTAAFNNLGIPGAILYDIVDETDFATKSTARSNALFSAILRSSSFGASMIKQALGKSPTVITLWIGNNDVLGYASSGGTKGTDAATGLLPTDVATFTYLYNLVGTQLAASGAKVVVANLPSISAIPYFTTVPAVLTSGTTTITLYGTTKSGVRALVYGEDLLLLTASSVLLDSSGQPTGVGLSASNPLPDKYVLDKDEVAIVNAAVTSFNSVISSVATAKGFALADMNALFNEFSVKNSSGSYVGKIVDGITFTPSYVTGNLFSLDGVHPTSRAQAIIANKFIEVINAKWSSSIPYLDVSLVPASLIIAKKAQFSKYGIPIIEKGTFDNVLF